MSYVLTDGGSKVTVFPYNVGLLRRDNPNVSFPSVPTDAQLAEWNVYPVIDMPTPAYDPLKQAVSEINPEYDGAVWRQMWAVRDLADYEARLVLDEALASLRSERDQRLSATDWTQLPDADLTPEKRQAWVAYRKQLRDLPENTPNPLNPVWPAEPGR